MYLFYVCLLLATVAASDVFPTRKEMADRAEAGKLNRNAELCQNTLQQITEAADSGACDMRTGYWLDEDVGKELVAQNYLVCNAPHTGECQRLGGCTLIVWCNIERIRESLSTNNWKCSE